MTTDARLEAMAKVYIEDVSPCDFAALKQGSENMQAAALQMYGVNYPTAMALAAKLAQAADACALAQAEGHAVKRLRAVAEDVIDRIGDVARNTSMIRPHEATTILALLMAQAAELARLREGLPDLVEKIAQMAHQHSSPFHRWDQCGPPYKNALREKVRSLLAQHQPQEAGS